MADVQKCADLQELGSETAVKAAGKYRQQGRNYVVEDGDIIFFKGLLLFSYFVCNAKCALVCS